MSRRSIATPCPTTAAHETIYLKSLDDTTTTLNFTTAFDASFRNTKPRRKSSLSVQFAIHEDRENVQNDGDSRCTALSRPARRMTGSFAQQTASKTMPESILESSIHPIRSTASRLSQAPRRPTNRLSVVPESATKEPESIPEEDTKTLGFTIKAARPLRRGTIYIPNDDTTMPSMYMGIFSPLKGIEASSDQTSEPTMEMTGIGAQMAVKRGQGRRTSIIDVAPRRAPLQTSSKISRENVFPLDRAGQGKGKENVPPGLLECEQQMLDLKLVKHPSSSPKQHSPPRVLKKLETKKPSRSSIYAPTAPMFEKSRPRYSLPASSFPSTIQGEPKKAWNAGNSVRHLGPVVAKPQHASKMIPTSISERMRPKPKIPTRFVLPVVQNDFIKPATIVLSEDIRNPTLYEENWLGHQEIAITQLVNRLFTAAQPGKSRKGLPLTLTQELVALYNTKTVAVLHNRIQAALLYGALSIPQDILDESEAFTKDVGRKQKFISLWIDNYDRDALEAALETVVGRQCRSRAARTSNSNSPARSPTKKALYNFIDAFLLRNEDTRPDRTIRNRAAWSYQRTLLRSMMLIKLLDMTKSTRSTGFSAALFLSSSSHKSSVSVLQRLFQMMNPAAGDPLRALSHIDYTVSHTQYPLEEFQYEIGNLAVDLRNGVRLTRLIELLLYPSASSTLERNADIDATTTISMPAGEYVDFQNGQDWPLSQHLKFPCQSRVARLWNVTIALRAVARVRGMEAMVEGIVAEDIVDGFREKTIRLLWALVGKCGLASLIDWDDVRWEIRRLRLSTTESMTKYIDTDDIDDSTVASRTFEFCKGLLKDWVRAVAATQGIEIHNFTTSFADGKIFEAIVNLYEPYLTPPSADSTTKPASPKPRRTRHLSTRLSSLGCSREFADLFSTPDATHIFDRDFVLATLAFLCSRLLTPSKPIRAAAVIQKAWRRRWAIIQAKRNETRKQMAIECSDHIAKRNEVTTSTSRGNVSKMSDDLWNRNSVQSPVSETSGDIWLSL